jgi:hypothetical protein
MKLLREENGSSIVIVSLLMVVIIGVAGLVIDMGILYETKSSLNKTARTAVLSGAQELINSDSSVQEVVKEIINADGEDESLKEINIDRDGSYKLNVVLEKEVPLYFLRLFKLNSMKLSSSSTAELVTMSRAEGAVPLGIDEGIPLEYMKEYSLKVDSGDSEYGNFGILALSGTGAMLYEQDLRDGYENEINVGDIITTQTGNISGKTRDAVNYRINLCPYLEDDITHRDNPRIILVLVYQPYEVSSNQLKQVKITGFAYFYIKAPMDFNDSSINGYFIKRVGNGFGDENLTNKGAYAIRLVE